MRNAVSLALVLASLAACGPDGRDDGTGGGGNGSGSGSGSGSGGGGENCSDSAKFVYTVDSNNTFSRWDATSKSFTDLGTLSCPSSGNPFSMSVDRDTIAWVLFDDNRVYRVDITGNLACTATTWSTQGGLDPLGMGFSSKPPGSTDETLFIAGGGAPLFDTGSTLAMLNTSTMQSSTVGTVTGWPELTGTGNAELWGWFPDSSSPRVEQIDKTTGQGIQTFPLSSLAGEPAAWAFAFWGGDFWIFLQKDFELATTVYQIDGSTGSIKGSTPTSSRRIVGAGVSTCAPVVIL